MSNTQLFIPKKCKVGFNLRNDTYTGKLGYIIYHDGKVWRKEPSWESWRHKVGMSYNDKWNSETRTYSQGVYGEDVAPIEFDNIPTEGFVLNKKVGGTSSGWNHRQTYSRVYDPRGWEFEIEIPNLLFILDECSSLKGKGLEGEFVYAWDGKELVLLPTSSYDYKLCEEYTKLQSQKITRKDLVEGCTYLTNKQDKLVYLGYYNVCENTYNNITDIEIENKRIEFESNRYYGYRDAKFEFKKPTFPKKHVFKTTEDPYYPFAILSSLNTIKEKASEDVHPKFAEFIDLFQKSEYAEAKPIKLVSEPFPDNYKFDGWRELTLYELGEINTVTELREEKVKFGRDYRKDNGEFCICNASGFRTSITKEEVIKKYGELYRIYDNGFKEKV